MDHDAIIAGGGLVGSALALALARSGLSVALVDPVEAETRAGDEFDGRSYALALASQRLLAAIGLWDGLEADAEPILEIKVCDGRPGEGPSPFVLEFDRHDIEEGALGFMVEDRHLRPALLAALDAAGVAHLAGRSVDAHEASPGGVAVGIGADELTARVLVGADGADSPTARRARIRKIGWDYGQTSLVAAVRHERPHGGVAHQFFMPAGPLAILPLRGNRCSIVWTERTETAERINALDDADYLDVLRPRFGDFLGGIELEGARFAYPLALALAERFVAPRLALAGDAAHRIHPIAGQGLNAGLRDVSALAEVLAEAARRGEDIGAADVLERYQRRRRFDTVALAVATDGFNRLYSSDNPLLRLGRGVGMSAVNAFAGLRQGFANGATA